MTKSSTPRKLNTRRQKFCEHIAAGESGTDAYLKAGFKVARSVARANAHRLLANADIAARIAELRKPQTLAAEMAKEDKLAFLAEIIRTPIGQIGPDSRLCQEYSEETIAGGSHAKLKRGKQSSVIGPEPPQVIRRRVKMPDKLRALELHSKLVGDFQPDRVEVDAAPKALDSIRERAAKVASALDLNARLRGRGTAARPVGLSRWHPATGP
jgi:hypothetical protein